MVFLGFPFNQPQKDTLKERQPRLEPEHPGGFVFLEGAHKPANWRPHSAVSGLKIVSTTLPKSQPPAGFHGMGCTTAFIQYRHHILRACIIRLSPLGW